MNPPKKVGVYSKFLNRVNVANLSKQNESVMSRIEQVETQHSRQRTLLSENEHSTPRHDKEETARNVDGSRLNGADDCFKHPKNSTFSNYTLRSASKKNFPKKQGIYSKLINKANVTNDLKQNETLMSRIEQSEMQNSRQKNDFKQNETLMSRTEQSEMQNSQRRNLFVENDPRLPRINEDQITDYIVPAKKQYSSNTSFASIQSSIRPHMNPRILLKRCDTEIDQFGRALSVRSDAGDNEGSVVAHFKKRQNELRIFDRAVQHVKKIIWEHADDLSKSANAYYMLHKLEIMLLQKAQREKKIEAELQQLTVGRENSVFVHNWLKSNEESDLASVITGSSQRNLPSGSNYIGSKNNINKTVYLLKDWTLVKGEGIFDVQVAGQLLNLDSCNLIEEKHVSSSITAANAVIVQTSCCMYQLQGKFLNPNKCIPVSISKYFQDGKFPMEWKEVIKLWSVLNLSVQNKGGTVTAHKSARNHSENQSDNEISDYYNGGDVRSESNFRPPSNYVEHRNERYHHSNMKDRRWIQDEGNDRWVREPVNEKYKRDLYESYNIAHESKLIKNREIEDRHIRGRYNDFQDRQEVHFREQKEIFQDSKGMHRPNVSYSRQTKRSFMDDDDDDDDEVRMNGRMRKKPRIEKNLPKRGMVVPVKQRLSNTIMTRSALRRNAELVQTPKSSKVSKLLRRQKTPMPPRTLCEQDETSIFDNSDLM